MNPPAIPAPSYVSRDDYYQAHAEEYFRATVDLDMRSIYERFLGELTSGAHIADAGCGSGRDTRAFIDKGYVVTSFDSSPEMARLASAYTGQNCKVLRFQEMDFQQEFDGIWACASLIHVPRHEMSDVLRRFVAAVRPGGVIYASFIEGAGERTGTDGRFYNCYTAEILSELIRRVVGAGEVVCWKSDEIASPAKRPPWLNVLFKKHA